jgi:hypothetical protein
MKYDQLKKVVVRGGGVTPPAPTFLQKASEQIFNPNHAGVGQKKQSLVA